MNKLKEVKKAIQETPPERLAQIEYQSHFLQMVGVSIACIILIIKGFWYIIFAFIFGLGISFSQGISAYQKYRNIIAIVGEEKPKDFEKDISFTRRRSKIINYVIGSFGKWISIILSVGITYLFLGFEHGRLFLSIVYPLTIFCLFLIIYLGVCYKICYPIYKKRIKGGNKK